MAGKPNDMKIRALKPSGRARKISDGDGLYIHVTENGSKLWRMFYRFGGRQKALSLGQYPKRPGAGRRRPGRPRAGMTGKRLFRAVAAQCLETQADRFAAATVVKKEKQFRPLFEAFEDKLIDAIVPQDILDAVKPYELMGKMNSAHEISRLDGQVFRYARLCGYITFDPATGLTEALKPIRRSHYLMVSWEAAYSLFWSKFDNCFTYAKTAVRARDYVRGLMSGIERKKWLAIG